jgi:AcrR family transcriptional regulator
MRASKEAVVLTASELADEKGLQGVTLKAVADRLGIRTPSLYNHIESLDDLLRAIAHTGMRAMNSQMSRVAIGKSGDHAIQAVSIEYLTFVTTHPGVYEVIQWAAWHGTHETEQIFASYTELLTTLIDSMRLKTPRVDEILHLLTGVLHGYITLQRQNVMDNPDEVRENLSGAIDTVLMGIRQKYD